MRLVSTILSQIAPDYHDLGTRDRGPMLVSLPKLMRLVIFHITIGEDGFEPNKGTGFVRVSTRRWLQADGCGQ
jgi:hypothetical protein